MELWGDAPYFYNVVIRTPGGETARWNNPRSYVPQEHERTRQQQRIFLQILDRQHDISFAVTGDTRRDLVVILQVLFRNYISTQKSRVSVVAGGNEGNSAHHFFGQISEREAYQDVEIRVGESRADKTVVLDRTSRRQACHNAPVTVRIGAGHDTQRILPRKRLIAQNRNLNTLALAESGILSVQGAPLSLTGKNVTIGFIDTGIRYQEQGTPGGIL